MTHVPTMSDDVEERNFTGTSAIAKVSYMTKQAGRLIIREEVRVFSFPCQSYDAYKNINTPMTLTQI